MNALNREGRFEPGKLWSLWDLMRTFRSGLLFDSVFPLSTFSASLGGELDIVIPADSYELFNIDLIVEELEVLQLTGSLASARRLQALAQQIVPYEGERSPRMGARPVLFPGVIIGRWKHSAKELVSRLRDELKGKFTFVIRSETAHYFNAGELIFGEDVSGNFPSASYDISEAAKCMALRRPTACVMHLMRVLEVGLRSLAMRVQVDFQHTNWHNALDQVESKIRQMNSSTHGPDWKDEQKFLSGAAAHFRIIKDAWRNHAMHVHENYSEERAEHIFVSVREFMRDLAIGGLSEVSA